MSQDETAYRVDVLEVGGDPRKPTKVLKQYHIERLHYLPPIGTFITIPDDGAVIKITDTLIELALVNELGDLYRPALIVFEAIYA